MQQDLHHRLEELINNTELGGRLPSEPKLAQKLGVSRATLREAMRTFEMQGLLRRRQGVGTFVLRPRHVIESGLEVLESIETLAERISLPVSLGSLEIEEIKADAEVAESLELKQESTVLKVSRVIHAEDRPIAFLVDILPRMILSNNDVDGCFTGSVLDLLLKKGDPVLRNSKCEISAISVKQEVARILNIQRGDALLCFKAILYSERGSPVDYSLSYFLPGYFKFHVVREIG
jgi:GntR family transcriptional regulator